MPNTRITAQAQTALKDLRHDIYMKKRKDITLQKIASCLIVLGSKEKRFIEEIGKHDC